MPPLRMQEFVRHLRVATQPLARPSSILQFRLRRIMTPVYRKGYLHSTQLGTMVNTAPAALLQPLRLPVKVLLLLPVRMSSRYTAARSSTQAS